MLTILGRANSSNVQKVLWCCEELGIPFEREDYGAVYGNTTTTEYLSLNPNARVPTIIEDGWVLWESNSIIRYFAARDGEGTLYPTDLRMRAMGERWMDWQLAVLGPAMFPVFHGLVRTPPEKRDLEAVGIARTVLSEKMAMVDRYLGDTEYLAGDSFSVGDIPVGVFTYRWFHLDIEREDYSNLERWHDALMERPAFVKHIDHPLT